MKRAGCAPIRGLLWGLVFSILFSQGLLGKEISFSPTEINRVGVIEITGKKTPISQSTWIYVKSALEYYRRASPRFIILKLDTPGGELFSAEKIANALKEIDFQQGIPIVSVIDNWAISAGALLAYSTRYIAVAPDASMGAAEPVHAGEGGKMVTASEKINSALRADFTNKAELFGRNPSLAEAMVDKDVIVVKRGNEIVKLDREDQLIREGAQQDVVISAKGKLLTLNARELIALNVADFSLPHGGEEFVSLFKVPPFQSIPNVKLDRFEMDWKTKFLSFIAMPAITSVLFLGMMLGFYMEFSTPGFGFPGSVALCCLVLICMGSYALDVIEVFEVVLLLLGVLFIALDLFLIPTFGVLGLVGIVMCLVGLFALMLPGIGGVEFEFDSGTFNAAGEVFLHRLAWLCATFVVGGVAIACLAKYALPSFRGLQKFVLSGEEETGYIAGVDPSKLPPVGTKGEVFTDLRPSGKILIGDEMYEAITRGEYIEKGKKILIIEHMGSVILVEET